MSTPMNECPLCHTNYATTPAQMLAVRLGRTIQQYICRACLEMLVFHEATIHYPAMTEYACNDDSCHEKAKAKGEQRFTLRAQDETAPECIVYWILRNIDTAPEQKLRHALEDALRARRWPNRKAAD